MDRKRIQCLSNASQMYPSIFNRFPVIQAVSLKIRHFSTFLAHFGLPWVRHWDNRGRCYMDRKRIRCLSNASQHVPCIYLQPFPRLPVIQAVSLKVRHFNTFCLPWVHPWDNRGKCHTVQYPHFSGRKGEEFAVTCCQQRRSAEIKLQ